MRKPIALGCAAICAALSVFLEPLLAETATGRAHSIQLDGAKVHYTEYGAGENALVFVHGWSCDETFWAGQTSLGGKLHVITLDLPGHGQSDKPQIPYTMNLYVRAIEAVLRDAKVKGAVLVGHSNGTPVIWQFYRKFPEKTRALVIVDGGLRPRGDKATMEKFIARLREADYVENTGKFIDNMTSSIADTALREKIRTTMLRTPQYVGVSEFEATLDPELWKPDKITVPVLMLLAKQPAWNAEYEQFARSIVPVLDYQVWEGVSHFLMLEKADEFNRAVVAFLEKHQLTK